MVNEHKWNWRMRQDMTSKEYMHIVWMICSNHGHAAQNTRLQFGNNCQQCHARIIDEYGAAECPFDTVRAVFVCTFYE